MLESYYEVGIDLLIAFFVVLAGFSFIVLFNMAIDYLRKSLKEIYAIDVERILFISAVAFLIFFIFMRIHNGR